MQEIWSWKPRWSCTFTTFLLLSRSAEVDPQWPVCENRAYRDEEIDPGGLRLLGVKESPLGDFPTSAAAVTHEHLFQQLRETWTDDCPRVMVQLGIQPAPGVHRNWSATSLWLRYFNHSGIVLAVDAVDDYLEHFQESLRASPTGDLLTAGGGQVRLATARSMLAAEGRAKAKDRPASFDAAGGGHVLAADEVMRSCSGDAAGPHAADREHPCSRVLQRMAQPEPLEYLAPIMTFDELWRQDDLLRGRHVDFLHVDLGMRNMAEMLRKSFAGIVAAREVSIIAFRVDTMWTKAELKNVVEWLDGHEYFSLFKMVCSGSSQSETFSYHGPGNAQTNPTTYLPLSGVNFDKVIDWDRIPLPQDVLAFDLRQPDIFKVVQLGDVHCDADETMDAGGTCKLDSTTGQCRGPPDTQPPERPQQLRVFRSESRALTIEWRPYPDGPRPDSYQLRVDPGATEDSLEHNVFDMVTGVQMHTINGLRPGTEYTIKLRAVGAAGASDPSILTHRTEREERPSAGSPYQVVEHLHCGMSTSEEVQPTGPPPNGVSFFQTVTDPDGCRARCDDNRQCVAFQVKVGDACWLYRRRPREGRLTGPRTDLGWFCGVRNPEL